MISDGSTLLTDPELVADSMNNFYSSIADNIGSDKSLPLSGDYNTTQEFINDAESYHHNHPSISAIKRECNKANNFSFSHVSPDQVHSIIQDLNTKKATGFDNILAKALKVASDLLAHQFCNLFNKCVDSGKFPDGAKAAEVIPIYKKSNALERKNHRPVSILTSSSKILEKLIESQLAHDFIPHVYNDCLSAFRAGYSCQHVLLHLCDTWRDALESRKLVGILLLDLSKAFDCLPFSLIVAKLKAYGASPAAIRLLTDYLTNRRQRVKVAGAVSSWNAILKGVPQGSILGPVIFNIFMNDVFCAIKDGFLFNYADDNTVLVTAKTKYELTNKLTESGNRLITWCSDNQMEANTSKFQFMISNEATTSDLSFGGSTIHSEQSVRLLGVQLDNKLNFSQHISAICKAATRQLNCLFRLGRFLDQKSKLLLYKSFVLSNFNYCPAVWHFCGSVNALKLEKIQFRALKFVYNRYDLDYFSLLRMAGLPTLELSRQRAIAIEVFKAIHKTSPSYISNLFKLRPHRYSLRSTNSLYPTSHSSTKGGLHSFSYSGTSVWNSLPTNLRTETDFLTFKRLLKNWEGVKCKCSYCRLSPETF